MLSTLIVHNPTNILINWTFKFDLPSCEVLSSLKIVHCYSYQLYTLLGIFGLVFVNFNGIIGFYSKCITHNQFSKVSCSCHWNLILTLVPYGVVSSSSLVSIISSLEHFVVIGMVSSLSFVFFILSPKHVGELGSSFSLLTILFIVTSSSISLL